jgi:nicotinamide-nucleotide amidase
MVAAALTDIAGSSDVFDRGWVTYSNAAKQAMVGVREASLAAHGAVSEEVAQEMAAGGYERSAANLCVSITGIAGPGGSEHKPEGRVCFALQSDLATHVETQEFGALGRENLRDAAREYALDLLLGAIDSFAPQF